MIVSKKRVLARYGSRCSYCGASLTLRTMRRDHVAPLVRFRGVRWSFSGQSGCLHPERHNLENIVPACARCNTDKGAMDLDTWRAGLRWPGWRSGVIFWFEKYKAGT